MTATPEPNSGNITSLDGLAGLHGRVIEFSRDGGQTWRCGIIGSSPPGAYGDDRHPEFGYSVFPELPPSGVSQMDSLTDRDFAAGLLVRLATDYTGKQFAYGEQPS
jgi:hypothetical protein